MKYVFFLGTNSALSASESVRVLQYEGYKPRPTFKNEELLGIEIEQKLPDNFLSRLGGCDRIGEVLAESDHLWTAPELLTLLSPLPKKLKLGFSVINTNSNIIRQLSFELKKLAREQESRLVFILPTPGKNQLNTAQVLFNKLHFQPNMEITIVKQEERWLLIRTVDVQDIPAYEHRDTSRPARDQVVGMLPPKLAQILLNLSLGQHTSEKTLQIYDPFCGGGTILQEGWLLKYKMTGSDNSQAMVDASITNINWLEKEYPVTQELRPNIFLYDITKPLPETMEQQFDAIVTEPYLGPALRTPLPEEDVPAAVSELTPLYLDFFKHIYPLLPVGGKVVFTIPSFRQASRSKGFISFPSSFLDEIASIGYSQRALIPEEIADSYQGSDRGTIIYSRPTAFVGREITLWEKVSL